MPHYSVTMVCSSLYCVSSVQGSITFVQILLFLPYPWVQKLICRTSSVKILRPFHPSLDFPGHHQALATPLLIIPVYSLQTHQRGRKSDKNCFCAHYSMMQPCLCLATLAPYQPRMMFPHLTIPSWRSCLLLVQATQMAMAWHRLSLSRPFRNLNTASKSSFR